MSASLQVHTTPPAIGHPTQTPLVFWAEGCFGQPASKTAIGVMHFGQWPVLAVIDSTQANGGQTAQQVVPSLPIDCPIVPDIQTALALKPKALMIGIAPPGGVLPPACWEAIKLAIAHGVHIINGLHTFLNHDPSLVALAQQHHVRLWDVRYYEGSNQLTQHLPRPADKRVITFVGTDCSIGKMFASLALHKAALAAGQRSSFVATGQTGIMIDGQGIPLDCVTADFMAGILEAEIISRYGQADWLWIEGQASLQHPAYSGVSMALLHGSAPNGIIVCHLAHATHIKGYPHVAIQPLPQLVTLYEQACQWSRPAGLPPAKVLGFSVNTSPIATDAEATAYLAQITQGTGLPATDPVRFGVTPLWQAVQGHF
jgi:uncharacterized NAD-dependent epimerase/dehydratase family protein